MTAVIVTISTPVATAKQVAQGKAQCFFVVIIIIGIPFDAVTMLVNVDQRLSRLTIFLLFQAGQESSPQRERQEGAERTHGEW